MTNRYQDYPSSRRSSQDWRDEDDNYDRGRSQFGARDRDPDEQGGSTGRFAGYGDFGRGEYGGGRPGWSGQGPDRGRSGQGQDQRQGSRGGSDYGYGYSGGESQRRYGQGSGSYGYGGGRSWNEPYGEGQQYTPGGQYAGERGGQGEGWGGQRDYGGAQRQGGMGFAGQGEHRGKGPKGYQRSDERVKELICERLQDDPAIDPSDVTVTVQGGVVTLEGTVDSRRTKNAIEEIAEQFGTQDVQSNLRVQRASQGQQGMQSASEAGRQGKPGEDNASMKLKQH